MAPFTSGRLLTRPGRRPPAGSVPGSLMFPLASAPPSLRTVVYGPDSIREEQLASAADLEATLAPGGRPGGAAEVAWIDLEGFGDAGLLEALGTLLGLHPLALADIVHTPQRPKAELHGDQLLVILQMARVLESGQVDLEQVSLVLGPSWVATFQERPGDVFDPVRQRLRSAATQVRRFGADYLLYALVDAIVDGYFAVVESLGERIDDLEDSVVRRAGRAELAQLQDVRRTLIALHRVQWRQRDAVSAVMRDEEFPISTEVRLYLRDAHDHAFQALDAIETYREMVTSLMDLHLSSASLRTNEAMQTLTIVATIFIPLTFVAGIYGMNFEFMPELHWRWGYPAVWGLMFALSGGLWLWFRRRGWLGDSADE